MKTYLVTGGAGFIGSHLSEALLEAGHRVLVLDDLSTGSLDNVVHLQTHPRFECVIDTVTNATVLADLAARADGIFHAVEIHNESYGNTIDLLMDVLPNLQKKDKANVIVADNNVGEALPESEE